MPSAKRSRNCGRRSCTSNASLRRCGTRRREPTGGGRRQPPLARPAGRTGLRDPLHRRSRDALRTRLGPRAGAPGGASPTAPSTWWAWEQRDALRGPTGSPPTRTVVVDELTAERRDAARPGPTRRPCSSSRRHGGRTRPGVAETAHLVGDDPSRSVNVHVPVNPLAGCTGITDSASRATSSSCRDRSGSPESRPRPRPGSAPPSAMPSRRRRGRGGVGLEGTSAPGQVSRSTPGWTCGGCSRTPTSASTSPRAAHRPRVHRGAPLRDPDHRARRPGPRRGRTRGQPAARPSRDESALLQAVAAGSRARPSGPRPGDARPAYADARYGDPAVLVRRLRELLGRHTRYGEPTRPFTKMTPPEGWTPTVCEFMRPCEYQMNQVSVVFPLCLHGAHRWAAPGFVTTGPGVTHGEDRRDRPGGFGAASDPPARSHAGVRHPTASRRSCPGSWPRPPSVTVELGPRRRRSLLSTCEAVLRPATGRRARPCCCRRGRTPDRRTSERS